MGHQESFCFRPEIVTSSAIVNDRNRSEILGFEGKSHSECCWEVVEVTEGAGYQNWTLMVVGEGPL